MDKQTVTALREALQGFLESHERTAAPCPCAHCIKGQEAIHNAWLQDHK